MTDDDDFEARVQAHREEVARRNRWKTLSDPDEMLDAWAEARDDRRWVVDKLRAGGPDDWHSMATNWNWDNGIAPFIWITRQPDCDKATAAHFYWGLGPEFYFGGGWNPEDSLEDHRFNYSVLLDLIDRWERGFYRRSEIQFDKPYWINRFDLDKIRAPVEAREAIPGRVVDRLAFFRDKPPQFDYD
jgi:Domain of unknown function (DUF4274)